MKFTIIFILGLFTWLLFSGIYDLFHISLGVFSCLVVSLICHNFLFESQVKNCKSRLQEIINLPIYSLWLLKEIFKANLHVLYLAYHPKLLHKINPRILSFRVTKLHDPFSRYIMGISITLVPGTVTIQIEDDLFTVHAISDEAAAGLPEPMESWVAWVFSNKQEGK